jgi:hypothetical protein
MVKATQASDPYLPVYFHLYEPSMSEIISFHVWLDEDNVIDYRDHQDMRWAKFNCICDGFKIAPERQSHLWKVFRAARAVVESRYERYWTIFERAAEVVGTFEDTFLMTSPSPHILHVAGSVS